jgi:(S)-mandelate dehydrogenase
LKPAWNVHDLRDMARRRLPRAIFDFVDCGSEDGVLIARNVAALQELRLNPRTLRDVSARDQSIELFGKRLPMPLLSAPAGIADLLSFKGELALARAAAAAGIPYCLATSATTPMEEISKAAGSGLWMQMYLWERRDLSWQVVERAATAGAEALILTVDLPVWPNREHNQRNGMANPIRPNLKLARDFALHPRWSLGVLGRYLLTGGLPQFANYPAEVGGKVTGVVSRQTNSASVSWADVAELKRRWPGHLLIKGLLHPEDARIAAEHGVDAVIVSNHGGRTFDAAPPAIAALPGVVDAVAGRCDVLFDSGVRRGTDVLKALALGAKAVLIGRPALYGLAAGGEAGAARAFEILNTEIDLAMAFMGVTALAELDRSAVLPAQG